MKARNVSVWLPPGYEGSDASHPVLYMHDGQNLFDPATANFGEWGVDEHLTRLIAGGQVRAPIVVGVWNTDLRLREYVPADLIAALPADISSEFRPILWSPTSDSGHAVALAWQAYVPAVLLWIGGVFWTLGYDTLYALQDIEDDAMIGVKSSARRLASAVRPGVAVFYGLAIVMVAVAGAAAGLGPVFWIGLVAYGAHLARQVIRLDRTDGAVALTLFKSNREAGLILLAAIALGSIVP